MNSVLGFSIFLNSLLFFPLVRAESHGLSYHFTTIWSPKGSNPPYTKIIASLDDVTILTYSSSSQKLHFLFDWMGDVDAGHWETLEEIAKYYEQRHQQTIQRLSSLQNYTLLHVFQVKFGCWIYEDNSTRGEEEFGVNGRDFIFLDNEKRKFMASVDEAAPLAKEWNRRPNSIKRQFHYKDVACVQWMRDYLNIKNNNLPKYVRPEVKVWSQSSDETKILQCLVYGFNPQEVIIWWVRNGTNYVPSKEVSPTLPHPDGTYQIRISVEVPTKEGDPYSCHVEHGSLEEILIVKLEAGQIPYKEKRRSHEYKAFLFIFFLLLVVFAVYIKISGRKTKAFTEPD